LAIEWRVLCSGNAWFCSVFSDRDDEQRQLHVPDVASSVSAAVRHRDDALEPVAVHHTTHPEHHRLPDVPHLLVHDTRSLRGRQIPLHHPHDAADPDGGENYQPGGVSVFH